MHEFITKAGTASVMKITVLFDQLIFFQNFRRQQKTPVQHKSCSFISVLIRYGQTPGRLKVTVIKSNYLLLN
jgi:hypothetical protein